MNLSIRKFRRNTFVSRFASIGIKLFFRLLNNLREILVLRIDCQHFVLVLFSVFIKDIFVFVCLLCIVSQEIELFQWCPFSAISNDQCWYPEIFGFTCEFCAALKEVCTDFPHGTIPLFDARVHCRDLVNFIKWNFSECSTSCMNNGYSSKYEWAHFWHQKSIHPHEKKLCNFSKRNMRNIQLV